MYRSIAARPGHPETLRIFIMIVPYLIDIVILKVSLHLLLKLAYQVVKSDVFIIRRLY